MENTSLLDRYWDSFRFVLKHKWLYLIPLALVFVNQIYQQFAFYYYYLSHFPYLTEQLSPDKGKYLYYSFLDRTFLIASQIDWRITINHTVAALSAIIPALGGGLGIVILILVFFKKLRLLFRKYPVLKTSSRYFSFIILIGILLAGTSFLILKNILLASVGIGIVFIGFLLMYGEILALIEGVFLLYMKSLLKREVFIMDDAIDIIGQNWKALFLLNLIFVVFSPIFYASLSLIPEAIAPYLPYEIATRYYSASSNSSMFPAGFYTLLDYLQIVVVIILLLVPFLLMERPSNELIPTIRKGLFLIKKNLGFYISLVISGVIVLLMLNILEQLLLTAPVFSYAYDASIRILYSLAQAFFLIIFSSLVFGWIVNANNKQP